METENNSNSTAVFKLRPIPSPITHLSFMASQILFRIVAAGTSIAAACLMFSSRESKMLFGAELDARYNYSPAFKFFTMMNVVASGFSLLSLMPVFTLGRKFSTSANYFFLFLHDLVFDSRTSRLILMQLPASRMLMILLVAGCGAATAIGQVGKYGNSHSGWIPICDNFGKFCHKVATSLILGYLSAFCYLLLTIISANKARQMPV